MDLSYYAVKGFGRSSMAEIILYLVREIAEIITSCQGKWHSKVISLIGSGGGKYDFQNFEKQ
jgi:hypothetical protein